MEIVITQLEPDDQEYQDANADSDCQPGYIQKALSFVPGKPPECNGEWMPYHAGMLTHSMPLFDTLDYHGIRELFPAIDVRFRYGALYQIRTVEIKP